MKVKVRMLLLTLLVASAAGLQVEIEDLYGSITLQQGDSHHLRDQTISKKNGFCQFVRMENEKN